MRSITAATWRNFPRYMLAAMGFVVLVNARFIYMAVTTFPGAAATDEFDTSNHYDAVLAAKSRQDALGWSEAVSATDRHPVITLRGPSGALLAGGRITAEAERPIGTDAPIALHFHEAGGLYQADEALPAAGQWDLRLNVAQGGHGVKVTRRIVLN